jgi:hypothetical protein
MDDVKDLLDGGDSKQRVNGMGCDVTATREETCDRHGNFTGQQILLRLDSKVRVPYWLPCPACKAEWEQFEREEEKRSAVTYPPTPTTGCRMLACQSAASLGSSSATRTRPPSQSRPACPSILLPVFGCAVQRL